MKMENLKVINYYPELRAYAGSINAVIIISYLEECFKRQGRFFYKFMEPCAHNSYKKGESWSEILQMTTTEFRTAFKNIGVVYKSKKAYELSQDKFQGKMYLSYYDRISKLTYYMRNDDLVNRKFDEIKMHQYEHPLENEDAEGNMCEKHNRSKSKGKDKGTKEDSDLINDEISVGIIYNKTNIDNKSKISQETKISQKTDIDSQASSLPFEEIKGLFNQICQSHETVTKWSVWQKQKLERLWKIYDRDIAIFRVVFEMVESSDFLSGRIKSFKAQLDWILKPNHFADILQGKYKNFKKAQPSACRFGEGMYSREWDFDEIERLEQRRIDKLLEDRGFAACL